jgi:uncharacterized hydrophobic protein (TIGR00271 family)
MAKGCMGLLLGTDLDVEVQLRWALKLARTRSLDLLILQHVESRDETTVEVDLTGGDDGVLSPVGRVVVELVATNDEFVVHTPSDNGDGETDEQPPPERTVRLKEIRCAELRTVREQVVAQIGKNKLKLVTSVHAQLNTTDVDLARERRLFLRYAPCEVVLCYGFDTTTDVERVIAAAGSGPQAAAALRLGRDLAEGDDGRLTAVRVNPDIGPDSERVATRRLTAVLQHTLGSAHAEVRRRVVVDDKVHRGLRRIWDEGGHDLVVLGASRHGLLGNQPSRGTAARLSKGDPRPAIAIVRAPAPIRSRFSSLLEGGLERFVPQIDRDNRISLVDRVQSSSNWDFDFFALMLLSTVIAAIGLVQNSSAVVIGAMLVAPLMTPLLGMGLALVQGNPVLARISLRAVLLGVAVSLAVASVTGLLIPGFDEPTREMLGRGGPGVLDLFVAFASGLAAAYASSRPGLLAALPGVAIAAALVPPIATSGLALSLGNFHLAIGALLLFAINMVTIVLATMVSFWAVGLRNIGAVSRWERASVMAVLLSVVALGIYLSVRPVERPADRRIPDVLLVSMQERLGADYRLASVAVAYDELGAQLNVRIVGDELASDEIARDLRRIARDHFNAPIRVRLVTEVQADVEPSESRRSIH